VLGEGGMGTVYLARQQQPIRREVALKVVKLGMDTREVIARFESERQALALMDHPHIARVFDAGSSEGGRPYFVMEYVPGIPITEYCDQKQLSNRERMELLLPVCQAVQHAHQKGVIHRDIKPSNVLVAEQDDKPFVKVIDFGIGKAIDQRLAEHNAFTQIGQFVGTPEYMSPEQAELANPNISTTTDVYSLGVLLYELLVGALPFDAKYLRRAGLAELLRIIREEQPPTPSEKVSQIADSAVVAERRRTNPGSLRRQLTGDLNWIVMKALEKEPLRRYATVSELAADMRRYLEHHPITAGPPSPLYQARKFMERHRLAVSAGMLVAASLIAGLIATVWEAHVAVLQRSRADGEAAVARQARSAAEQSAKEAKQNEAKARDSLARAEEQQRLAERQSQQAAAQRDANRRLLYVSQVNLAAQDWETNNIERMEALLANQIPASGQEDLRGFEWYYLWRSCHRERSMVSFPDAAHAPRTIAFFPDAKCVAVGTSEGIELLDIEVGRQIGTLQQSGVSRVAISADSKRLVAYGRTPDGSRGELVLWDVASRKRLATLDANLRENGPETSAGRVVIRHASPGIALSNDGSRVAFVEAPAPGSSFIAGGEVKVWDITTHQEIWGLKGVNASSLAASPDGKMVAVGTEFRVPTYNNDRGGYTIRSSPIELLDMATGKLVTTFEGDDFETGCITFSPDAKTLASGSSDGIIKLRNLQTGVEKTIAPGHSSVISFPRRVTWSRSYLPSKSALSNAVLAMAFSPDGKTLASRSRNGMLTLRNAESGEIITDVKGHRGEVSDFAFSPDGASLASVSVVDRTLRLWDISSRPDALDLRGFNNMNGALSPSGEILAVPGGAEIALWDVSTGTSPRKLHTSQKDPLAFSPDGKALATTGRGVVTLWDTATLREICTLTHSSEVRALTFSPDGKILLMGDVNHTVKVWNWRTGRHLATVQAYSPSPPARVPPFGGIQSIAFSHDGSMFATADPEGSTILWNTGTLRQLSALKGEVHSKSVVFAPTGKVLATVPQPGQGDDHVKLWDLSSGRNIVTLTGQTGNVGLVAFSPDNRRIATASAGPDGTVRIWGIPVGDELATFRHADLVTLLAFSNDGAVLVTGSQDNKLRFWRAATEAEVVPRLNGVRGQGRAVSFFFAPGEPRTTRRMEPARAAAIPLRLFGAVPESDAGQANLVVNPPTAQIRIRRPDGTWQRTQAGIQNLRPGLYALYAEAAGYIEDELYFAVASERKIEVELTLMLPISESDYKDPSLHAPNLVSPRDNELFHFLSSRLLTFQWEPSPGAASYILEWDVELNGMWSAERSAEEIKRGPGSLPNKYMMHHGYPVGGTQFSFHWVDRSPGRWRVWPVNATGRRGTPSEWRTFRVDR
jgi:WD40 repeat protein